MKNLSRLAIALAFLVTAKPASAAKFANQFIEFDLPQNWQCLLEGAEWVCQNTDPLKKKEAIIILAAKIQGDQDSLDQYLKYLQGPKAWTTPQGKAVTSQVKYAKNLTIQDSPWVDAFHLESEVPGFYTRYLGTVKEGLGILVTYSVNKNKYQEYSALFDSLVKSLKAFRREGGLNAAPASSDLFKTAKLPTSISEDSIFPGSLEANDTPKRRKKEGFFDDPMMFYGAIAAGAVLLMSMMKKKK